MILNTDFKNNMRHIINVDQVLGECLNLETEEQDEVDQIEKSKVDIASLGCVPLTDMQTPHPEKWWPQQKVVMKGAECAE